MSGNNPATPGDRLVTLRRACGFTSATAFAHHVGCDARTVRRSERGEPVRRQVTYLLAVAEATGVSLDWLVTGACPTGQGGDWPPRKPNGRPIVRVVECLAGNA